MADPFTYIIIYRATLLLCVLVHIIYLHLPIYLGTIKTVLSRFNFGSPPSLPASALMMMRPLFLCSLLGHYYITRRSNSIQHHHHYRHYAHLLLTESEGSSPGSEIVHGMGHDSARAIQFVKWKFFSAIVIKFTNRFYKRVENEGWFAIYSGEGSFVPMIVNPANGQWTGVN